MYFLPCSDEARFSHSAMERRHSRQVCGIGTHHLRDVPHSGLLQPLP